MKVFNKRTVLLCFLIYALITSGFAHSFEGFRYQTEIRDSDNTVLANHKIVLKIDIFKQNNNDTTIYSEVHDTMTNQSGIVDIIVGRGKVESGDFSAIDWAKDANYIQVKNNPHGKRDYQFLKREQLPIYYQQINKGIVLDETQHSGKSSPHTLTVVRPNPSGKFNGHTYWGYVGEAHAGNIDLRFSEDLLAWRPYRKNPVITGDPVRWPSVLYEDGYFYMAHTIKFGGESSLVLRKSIDGIRFSFVSNLTEANDGEATRNPFLFKDPNTRKFYLLFKRRTKKRSEIRIKESKTLEGLCQASSKILLTRDSGTIAAPSMFYANDTYWLLTEGGEKPWVVEAYAGKSPTGLFIENPKGWVLTDDDACPFPYVQGDTLYNFICHRENGTIWKIGLVTSILSSSKDH